MTISSPPQVQVEEHEAATRDYELPQTTLRSTSSHEKRLTFLPQRREEQTKKTRHSHHHHHQHDQQQQPQREGCQRASTRTSMVNLLPPTAYQQQRRNSNSISTNNANANINVAVRDDDSDSSEVFFALKVSNPSRLIRRRSRRNPHHTSTCSRSGHNNSYNSHSRNKLLCSSASSFLDASITLLSLAEGGGGSTQDFFQDTFAHQEDHEEDPLVHPSISSIPIEDLPLPHSAAAPAAANNVKTNTTSSMASYNHFYNSTTTNLSQQTCFPNHNSFQTEMATTTTINSNFPVLKRAVDPRKQRRSMMNWLANRLATRHLMAPPCPDPQPPTFVKVIHLHNINNSDDDNDQEDLLHKQEQELLAWMNTKLEGMGSAHSRSTTCTSSYHRKVASAMA